MAWHDRKYAGPTLRVAGLILIGLAALIAHRLFAVADPRGKETPTAYLLALIEMLSACAGAALAVLGQHLFDQVDLPSRWTIHDLRGRQD